MAANSFPNLAKLTIHDPDGHMPHGLPNGHGAAEATVPKDIAESTDAAFDRLKDYARNLPYSIEPNAQMQRLLDLFLARIGQCILAKDYDPGLQQWDSMLN
jgi:proteasome activator subunit 4